jgi:hypothetical protein
VKGVFWGTILVSEKYFYYLSACCQTPNEPHLKYVDHNKNSIGKKLLILQWSQIDEVMKRKVVNIFQGIDITTSEKKVYTFNLCSEQKADDFIAQAKTFLSESRDESHYRVIENPKSQFIGSQTPENQILTEWKNGQRTNMELLMLINKFSGRSFNDMT